MVDALHHHFLFIPGRVCVMLINDVLGGGGGVCLVDGRWERGGCVV